MTAQSLALLFRGARDLTPRLALYAEYDFLHDVFAGIDGRNAITGGLAYRVINSDRQKFIVSAGVGVTHEARVVGDDLTEGILTQGALYSLKLSQDERVRQRVRHHGIAGGLLELAGRAACRR